MDSLAGFLVFLEILMCYLSLRAASYDLRLPSPDSSHRDLARTGIESDYAYTEVRTPFYYYYFYAPTLRNSYFQESHLESPYTSRNNYPFAFHNSRIPQDIIYSPHPENAVFYPTLQNEYLYSQSPYEKPPDLGTSTYYKKFNSFPEQTFSRNLKPNELYNSFRTPASNFRPSSLPSVLSSYIPNIIRKEHQVGTMYNSELQPYSYAPSFKDHAAHPPFTDVIPSYKSAGTPSLFSAVSPNIIRHEETSVNNLFRPQMSKFKNKIFPFQIPSSVTQYFNSLTPPSTQKSYDEREFTPILPSVFPEDSSSTHSPASFQTNEPEFLSFPEVTSTHLVTSTETPAEVYSTLPPVGDLTSLRHAPYETTTSGPPRLMYEAPGRTQPRR